MSFYTSNAMGLALNGSLMSSLQLSASNIAGFFLKSDLQLLLNNPTCDGLRFYNVQPSTGSRKILAAAAKDDGFEVDVQYLLSHAADASGQDVALQPITDREEARSLTDVSSISNQFLSFYSRNMLEMVLLNNAFQGVAFFEANLGVASDDDLINNELDHLVTIKSNTKTHLAIPIDLMNTSINLPASNVGNLLSMHPCPGHCLKVSTTPPSIAQFPSSGSASAANDPYLFSWKRRGG